MEGGWYLLCSAQEMSWILGGKSNNSVILKAFLYTSTSHSSTSPHLVIPPIREQTFLISSVKVGNSQKVERFGGCSVHVTEATVARKGIRSLWRFFLGHRTTSTPVDREILDFLAAWRGEFTTEVELPICLSPPQFLGSCCLRGASYGGLAFRRPQRHPRPSAMLPRKPRPRRAPSRRSRSSLRSLRNSIRHRTDPGCQEKPQGTRGRDYQQKRRPRRRPGDTPR
jgi:hypothetical protein